jgi:hypothetical protein
VPAGALRNEPLAPRFRVSRARLAYIFERYAIREELLSVSEASTLLGLSRESIALLVLQGKLSVAEAVKERPDDRPARMLVRSEVEGLKLRTEQGVLPVVAK